MAHHSEQPERTRWSGPVIIEMAGRVALFVLLWLAITSFDVAALPFGALAVILATVAGWHLRPPDGRRVSLVGGVRFLGLLALGIARSSADVARRAFLPRSRMAAPSFVTYRLHQPSEARALGLSYAMTLMPGTVGAAVNAAEIDLHVLDRREGATGIEGVEKALAGAIREAPPHGT